MMVDKKPILEKLDRIREAVESDDWQQAKRLSDSLGFTFSRIIHEKSMEQEC